MTNEQPFITKVNEEVYFEMKQANREKGKRKEIRDYNLIQQKTKSREEGGKEEDSGSETAREREREREKQKGKASERVRE